MTPHPIRWTSPAPMWGQFAGGFTAADEARPALLRFADDEFMEQLLAILAADPRRLAAIVARPETWRTPGGQTPDLIERVALPRMAKALARLRRSEAILPPVAATTDVAEQVQENGVDRSLPLKLYQPAHQRHYVVAANLVCAIPGLPDRAIASGGREQVAFVLRRLLPPKNAAATTPRHEFAFVKDAIGARWQRIEPPSGGGDESTLIEGEELLPLFPLAFRDDRNHPRRMLGGAIPVGRREEYMGTRAQHDIPSRSGPAVPPSVGASVDGGTPPDPTKISARKEQLKLDVIEPWKNLIRTAWSMSARLKEKPAPDAAAQEKAIKAVNHQLQMQSWLVLLDFADYLALHLPHVWAAVGTPAGKGALSTAARALFDWLDGSGTAPIPGATMDSGGRASATSLRDALDRIRKTDAVRTGLEQTLRVFPDTPEAGLSWPPFVYPLAAVTSALEAKGIHESLGTLSSDPALTDDVEAAVSPLPPSLAAIATTVALLDRLVVLVIKAIDTTKQAAPAPPLPFAAQLRDALATTPGDEGWFVIRCVYVRCDCGPLQPSVVSAPSQRFQLASFFDPDAPARPIRIALPLDTTPAGLRKFNKNTAFVMSDVLCGQVQRAKGMGFVDLVLSVLPWPFHKDLSMGSGPCENNASVSIGMICSLSIPIITICALILLIMIVLILDLIFRWVPWFIMCFPLPGLKAKK